MSRSRHGHMARYCYGPSAHACPSSYSSFGLLLASKAIHVHSTPLSVSLWSLDPEEVVPRISASWRWTNDPSSLLFSLYTNTKQRESFSWLRQLLYLHQVPQKNVLVQVVHAKEREKKTSGSRIVRAWTGPGATSKGKGQQDLPDRPRSVIPDASTAGAALWWPHEGNVGARRDSLGSGRWTPVEMRRSTGWDGTGAGLLVGWLVVLAAGRVSP